jgi:hypothetical protein
VPVLRTCPRPRRPCREDGVLRTQGTAHHLMHAHSAQVSLRMHAQHAPSSWWMHAPAERFLLAHARSAFDSLLCTLSTCHPPCASRAHAQYMSSSLCISSTRSVHVVLLVHLEDDIGRRPRGAREYPAVRLLLVREEAARRGVHGARDELGRARRAAARAARVRQVRIVVGVLGLVQIWEGARAHAPAEVRAVGARASARAERRDGTRSVRGVMVSCRLCGGLAGFLRRFLQRIASGAEGAGGAGGAGGSGHAQSRRYRSLPLSYATLRSPSGVFMVTMNALASAACPHKRDTSSARHRKVTSAG